MIIIIILIINNLFMLVLAIKTRHERVRTCRLDFSPKSIVIEVATFKKKKKICIRPFLLPHHLPLKDLS